MSLTEVAAVDADAGDGSASLFVLCRRSPDAKYLSLQLLDPPTVLQTQVAARDKPRALDCSASEFLAAVEKALTGSDEPETRFQFRWSRAKQTLTLLERAEFAMKFCALKFQAQSQDAANWCELLRQVATQQNATAKAASRGRKEMDELKTLLDRKEALLETALQAKQREEGQLLSGFCAVLNAKKDEVRRLQRELAMARDTQQYNVKPTMKRKVAVPKKRKAAGAKLKRKKEEEELSEASREESGGDSTVTEDDEGEGSLSKKVKNDAVRAYSQLPADLRPGSVQISSAEDLLSSMDEIIQKEEDVSEATQRGDASRGNVNVEPVAKTSEAKAIEPSKSREGSRTRKAAALKTEPTRPPKPEPVKPPRPASPVDEPMDSEEEDILDMLS
jgi:hypothetical protein